MAEATLEMLGELMQRMLGEMRDLRGEVAELKDRVGRLEVAVSGIKEEQLVQGAILIRLEGRMIGLEARLPISRDDEVIAALQQQILRLERRISKLEGHG